MTTRTDRPGRSLQPRWPDRIRQRWSDRRRGGRLPRNLRRGAAAALALTAALLLLVPPRPADGVRVVVLARDLPIGAVLAEPDLVSTAVLDPPDGALTGPALAVGRTLAGATRRGEVLTDVRLVDPVGPQPGPDRVAVPIQLADATVTELLRPGMHVAVVAVADDGSAAILVPDAVVLLTPPSDVRRDQAPPVVLAVPPDSADRVVAAALTGTVALRFT
ncbi:SAF domain-containing protein [Nakamurella sp.]|uniref:SAF domain-containing protein n=1 Tax=Nakamurella sp. TaxID=1869182 RepID=UPI00378359E4